MSDTKTGGPTAAYPNPFLWVPSSYLAMGLIYVTVGSVANVMFKNMGMDNINAAFWSSILGFPYTFKFVWAPLLELYQTKKSFVVLMQFCLAASIAGVAFALKLPALTWLVPVLVLLAISGLLGATQDIGSDGVYVTTLPPKEMAKYTGFQSMCWNAGFLLAAGPLITISGMLFTAPEKWEDSWMVRIFSPLVKPIASLTHSTGNWSTAWMVIMLTIAGIMLLAGLYHSRLLPPGAKAVEDRVSMSISYLTFLLFSFRGRIRRAEYWVGQLLLIAFLLLVYLADRSISNAYPVALLALLTALLCLLALQAKRWHDRNKPGTMILVNLIPVIGPLWSFVELGFFRGALDSDHYGDHKPMPTTVETLETFFDKKGILLMVAFAFFYRSGYGLIDKMGPLFMIDDRAKGGLGLSNQLLGNINGTFGTAAFIIGSLIGGWIVSRFSLKKTLLILCLCLNVPNVTFLILSQTLPTNYYVIATIVTFEKLGWGIGCVGHMIYMMQQIAPGPYRTAHYTIATALMGACMMLTGAVSGYLQSWVGYHWFFIIVLFAAAPSILVTILAPFHNPDTTGRSDDDKPEAAAASQD